MWPRDVDLEKPFEEDFGTILSIERGSIIGML